MKQLSFNFKKNGLGKLQAANKKIEVNANIEPLSPNNEKLMKLMSKFTSKDNLRPAMQGVNFDETGVTVTDGQRLFIIYGKTEKHGIFKPVILEIINERFPDYKSVIPRNNWSVEFDTNVFVDLIKKMDSIIPKKTLYRPFLMTLREQNKCEIYFIDEDNENQVTEFNIDCEYEGPSISIGFNVDIWKAYCQSVLSKFNSSSITIGFNAPNRALTIYTETPFGNSLFLGMPCMTGFDDKVIDFKESEKQYYKRKDKILEETKAKYAIKIIKIKALTAKAKLKLALI